MMNGEERIPQSFSWTRRWGAYLNLFITVSAMLALVGMVNYLAIRHYTRWHWNRTAEAELSPRTLHVLGTLTNTVRIIAYYDSEDPLFARVKGLLKEYQYASPRVQVQMVDYLRDAGTAKLIKQQYKLSAATDKNLIIFDANGRSKVIQAGELSDYDYSELIGGQSKDVFRTHFKGEQLFTSAIFGVANERSPLAYFLIGNGEHSPDGGDNPDGYGKFSALLHDENSFELRKLPLVGTNEVPANCNLLIIAGPTQPLSRETLDKIQNYLEQGGRLLLTFNSATVKKRATGLERLLARWGVDVGDNVVLDVQNSQNRGMDLVPVELGKHPIVNALQSAQVQLYLPRSVRALRPAGRGDELKVEELLFTGPESVVLSDIHSKNIDPTQKGPQSLMVAVEKSVAGLQRGSTRLVVLGDSTIWGNQFIEAAANRDFAAFTANWLVNQSVLLHDIPRRSIHTYKLTMTRAQLRSMQLVLLLGLPGAVLFLGLIVWSRRRH